MSLASRTTPEAKTVVRSRQRRKGPAPEEERHLAIGLSDPDTLALLREGEVIGGQRIPWSSNYTFLVHIDAGEQSYIRAVYKPRDGERPLYDFPNGNLYKREYAAYLLSRALGWPNIPATLVREGPYGVGSMQTYVETDPEITYFDLIGDRAEDLRSLAVFDLLTNNADRKGGHCLLGADGAIWSIDHGLTFHPYPKLRTVMLEFWGTPIPDPLLADVEALIVSLEGRSGDVADLEELLDGQEVEALRRRAESVLDNPVIPELDPRRDVPWPLV